MIKAPPFDLVMCVGKAYQFVWAERQYLLRLALIPFAFKLIFFTLGYMQGGQDNMLRLSLIMVPAWLAEGWMLSHVVRLVLLGQRWPFIPTGERSIDLPVLHQRYRGVMGGLVAFTLIQLLIGGWFAGLMGLVPISLDLPAQEQPAVSPGAAIGACLMLGAAIYLFRFLWIYIPLAVGMQFRPVVTSLARGASLSLRMIGVWLLCAVPALVILQMIMAVILSLSGDAQANALLGVSVLFKVILDLVKNILCAGAMAYAFQQMFGGKSSA